MPKLLLPLRVARIFASTPFIPRRHAVTKCRDSNQFLIRLTEYIIHLYLLLVIILVIACLISVPAFSISFFDKPVVTHTFSAGCGCHCSSLGLIPSSRGMALRRVTRIPRARHYLSSIVSFSSPTKHTGSMGSMQNLHRLQPPA